MPSESVFGSTHGVFVPWPRARCTRRKRRSACSRWDANAGRWGDLFCAHRFALATLCQADLSMKYRDEPWNIGINHDSYGDCMGYDPWNMVWWTMIHIGILWDYTDDNGKTATNKKWGVRWKGEWGYPNSWMVYFMEHPMKLDDLGVPILGNHQILGQYWG